MQTLPTQNDEDWLTDRPAPYFPNLCSVQAIGADPTDPDATFYRKQSAGAARWISNVTVNHRFSCYLLRMRSNRWDLYGPIGDPLGPCKGNPITEVRETPELVSVERETFLQEACTIVGDPKLTLLACAEGHAGASAADHANFKVVCRRMIAEAGPADLEQVYLLDSRRWPCRVTGVFANVANLSPTMQDVFLDRVEWLQNSWPMVWEEFREILADRLAQLRPDYVGQILRECGRAAGMAEHHITAVLAKWVLASPGPKYRFALHIVETLREGLVYQPGAAETFSPEIVERRGAAVVKDYKRRLTLG